MYCAITRVPVSSHNGQKWINSYGLTAQALSTRPPWLQTWQGSSYIPGAWFAGGLWAAVNRYSEQVTLMADIWNCYTDKVCPHQKKLFFNFEQPKDISHNSFIYSIRRADKFRFSFYNNKNLYYLQSHPWIKLHMRQIVIQSSLDCHHLCAIKVPHPVFSFPPLLDTKLRTRPWRSMDLLYKPFDRRLFC